MSAGDWKEMYQAASSGNLSLVQYHIGNGVNPNYQHPEILSTPLVAAITSGHTEIARYLLENGADPNLLSEFDNMTPRQAAQFYERQDILQLLEMDPKPKSWLEKIFELIKLS